MGRSILIRDVPDEVISWLDRESEDKLVSRQDLVRELLSATASGGIKGEKNPPAAGSPGKESPKFSFADFFAGIGGFRLGLEACGGRCVFSCEWDRYAQKTYRAWFGEVPAGDINDVDIQNLPRFDVLAAGFPCQPFSIAGVSKKTSLGRAHGFEDRTQGTLFFNIARILHECRPPVAILENVKNLLSHDRGQTWRIILDTLEKDLGYKVFHRIYDASSWVPQHRERIFIVALDKDVFGDSPCFSLPDPPQGKSCLLSILDPSPDPKYVLSDHLWSYLQQYAQRHKEKGNGFGYGIADPNGIARTLSARYHKDGSEILISRGKGNNPRRLTPRECARLMGYPDQLPIVVSDTQAYRQFGNSLIPAIASHVGHAVVNFMKKTGVLSAGTPED